MSWSWLIYGGIYVYLILEGSRRFVKGILREPKITRGLATLVPVLWAGRFLLLSPTPLDSSAALRGGIPFAQIAGTPLGRILTASMLWLMLGVLASSIFEDWSKSSRGAGAGKETPR